MFSCRSFIVLAFVFKSDSFQVFLKIYSVKKGLRFFKKVSTPHIDIQLFQHHLFRKDNLFFTELSFCFCQKSTKHVCVGLYEICFRQGSICLFLHQYLNVLIIALSLVMEVLQHCVSFSKLFLFRFLSFHMNFNINLATHIKMAPGIVIDYTESMDRFRNDILIPSLFEPETQLNSIHLGL